MKLQPGMIVQLVNENDEERMGYYGYWLKPYTMYECIRDNDVCIVSDYCDIDNGNSWCEFVRNDELLRVWLHKSRIIIVLNPTQEQLHELELVKSKSYHLTGIKTVYHPKYHTVDLGVYKYEAI